MSVGANWGKAFLSENLTILTRHWPVKDLGQSKCAIRQDATREDGTNSKWVQRMLPRPLFVLPHHRSYIADNGCDWLSVLFIFCKLYYDVRSVDLLSQQSCAMK